jgi:hypothetical protein
MLPDAPGRAAAVVALTADGCLLAGPLLEQANRVGGSLVAAHRSLTTTTIEQRRLQALRGRPVTDAESVPAVAA